MKVYLFLADGFEEIETITPIDILRRAEIEVAIVSIMSYKEVTGAHGIKVVADMLFNEPDYADNDLLLLPGGMPGTKNLDAHLELKNLLIKQANQGKYVAAICAAPSILGKMGLLEGKAAICYPGFESQLLGATLSVQKVVQSANIITAMGAGVALPFALKLVEVLKGKATADKIEMAICC